MPTDGKSTRHMNAWSLFLLHLPIGNATQLSASRAGSRPTAGASNLWRKRLRRTHFVRWRSCRTWRRSRKLRTIGSALKMKMTLAQSSVKKKWARPRREKSSQEKSFNFFRSHQIKVSVDRQLIEFSSDRKSSWSTLDQIKNLNTRNAHFLHFSHWHYLSL